VYQHSRAPLSARGQKDHPQKQQQERGEGVLKKYIPRGGGAQKAGENSYKEEKPTLESSNHLRRKGRCVEKKKAKGTRGGMGRKHRTITRKQTLMEADNKADLESKGTLLVFGRGSGNQTLKTSRRLKEGKKNVGRV